MDIFFLGILNEKTYFSRKKDLFIYSYITYIHIKIENKLLMLPWQQDQIQNLIMKLTSCLFFRLYVYVEINWNEFMMLIDKLID